MAIDLLGGLVSCIVIVFASTILYFAVVARFFGRAARHGNLDSGVADSLGNPYFVLGLSLFFIIGLPFAAWYEGLDDPEKSDSMHGCGSVVTVYLGGGILKALRVFIPRKSPLSHPQFQMASALLAHLLQQSQPVDAEALAQGILSGNPHLTRHDFDVVMRELRDRNLVTGDPVKLESRFKAEIRHAEG